MFALVNSVARFVVQKIARERYKTRRTDHGRTIRTMIRRARRPTRTLSDRSVRKIRNGSKGRNGSGGCPVRYLRKRTRPPTAPHQGARCERRRSPVHEGAHLARRWPVARFELRKHAGNSAECLKLAPDRQQERRGFAGNVERDQLDVRRSPSPPPIHYSCGPPRKQILSFAGPKARAISRSTADSNSALKDPRSRSPALSFHG